MLITAPSTTQAAKTAREMRVASRARGPVSAPSLGTAGSGGSSALPLAAATELCANRAHERISAHTNAA